MDDIKKGFEHLYNIVDDDLKINVKQVEKMVLQKIESLENRKEEILVESGERWTKLLKIQDILNS